ncbi:MAG: CBS domain-containing protein [Coxiellaceae bacterium]|nr:CBS domain-containing protein [Coxiellaceae bacterium]
MAKYEALPTISLQPNHTQLQTLQLPELVHLDDPALSILIDFTKTPPHTITPEDTLDHAIHEMEASGAHLLLVINKEGYFQGIISAEDLWGEKPIKLIQERRVHRDQLFVKMIMAPHSQIIALDFSLLKNACVGHIVKTLSQHHKHYALVVNPSADNASHSIHGVFTLSQISKQLHMDLG